MDDVVEDCSGVGGLLECRPWHVSVTALFQYQNRLLSGMDCRRPDCANYRMLLWKCLSGIDHQIVESRSQILVPLFLRFIRYGSVIICCGCSCSVV